MLSYNFCLYIPAKNGAPPQDVGGDTLPPIRWVLKKLLIDEGNETVTNCNGLKLEAADGRKKSNAHGAPCG